MFLSSLKLFCIVFLEAFYTCRSPWNHHDGRFSVFSSAIVRIQRNPGGHAEVWSMPRFWWRQFHIGCQYLCTKVCIGFIDLMCWGNNTCDKSFREGNCAFLLVLHGWRVWHSLRMFFARPFKEWLTVSWTFLRMQLWTTPYWPRLLLMSVSLREVVVHYLMCSFFIHHFE